MSKTNKSVKAAADKAIQTGDREDVAAYLRLRRQTNQSMSKTATQPSAAAMRAARIILCNILEAEKYTLGEIAADIDRETGLPELLEACKAIVFKHGDSPSGWSPCRCDTCNALRATIDKAETGK